MKKIIFTFLLLFIYISNTQAITYSTFKLGQKVPNMHIESVDGDNVHNGIPFVLIRDDNEFVYCINPFQRINTTDNYHGYTYNNPLFNLSDYQLNRMNLIAYFGYGYKNHTDIKWYGITQFLIWKTLNLTDIYFTDDIGNKVDDYGKELKELEDLVDNYYKLPSFSEQHFEYDPNSKYTIIDTNEVLNEFEILNTNIDAYIKNNELYIDTKQDGIYSIEFIKRNKVDRDYILYILDNYQSLIYSGKFNDIKFSITVEVNSGTVTVNKVDSENKKRIEATLEGAIYGLYNEDELITTIKTNELGIGYIENLPLGKYYIKEIIPSVGYELDQNIYEFEITKDSKNINIVSQENVIKGNLLINKYYGEKDNYEKEDGAVFEVYDKNNILVGKYETKDGLINEPLEYGDYLVKQIDGLHGYNFVEKFKINIRENKDYIYKLYDEREVLIVDVPNTSKIDYYRFIPRILISIGFILIFISKVKEINKIDV